MADGPFLSVGGEQVPIVSLNITIDSGVHSRPWSDPDSTPLEDIRGAIAAFWEAPGFQPNTLWVSIRFINRLARRTMSKRAFRRWRGRMKAERRYSNPWCCQPGYCKRHAPSDYYNPSRCKDCIRERAMMESVSG